MAAFTFSFYAQAGAQQQAQQAEPQQGGAQQAEDVDFEEVK